MNSDKQEDDEYYDEYYEISDKFCNKHILIKYFVKSPDFFDIDKVYNDYIYNQNKKLDSYLDNCDFKLVFDNISSHIKNDYKTNSTIFKLKSFLLYSIGNFIERGHKFYLIFEMNIKTNTNKRYMKYEHYNNQPMQAVESKLNEVITRNPHLIHSLDRTIINPLIRKYFHIP